MKLSSSFKFFSAAAFTLLATSVSADTTHQVLTVFNTLIFYDTADIADPNFVYDVANGTTLALGGAVGEVDKANGDLTWDAIYEKTDRILGLASWNIRGSRSIDLPRCAPAQTSVSEALAAVYDSNGGEDASDLGVLLQSNNFGALDPTTSNVINTWLEAGFCPEDGRCVVDGSYALSVVHLDGSQMTMHEVRIFLSPAPAEPLTKPQSGSFVVSKVVTNQWELVESLYSDVRETVANQTKTFPATGPAPALDPSGASVQPYMPVVLSSDCSAPASSTGANRSSAQVTSTVLSATLASALVLSAMFGF